MSTAPERTVYASLGDVIECKGRVGSHGSLHERLALWLARKVASALMRDAIVRREFAISLAIELKRAGNFLDAAAPLPSAKDD